jgi:hypothetical protein
VVDCPGIRMPLRVPVPTVDGNLTIGGRNQPRASGRAGPTDAKPGLPGSRFFGSARGMPAGCAAKQSVSRAASAQTARQYQKAHHQTHAGALQKQERTDAIEL